MTVFPGILQTTGKVPAFKRVTGSYTHLDVYKRQDPDVRNYTYTFFEGKLYYRENSEMVRKEVSQTCLLYTSLEQIMSPEFMGQLGYAGSGSGGGGGSPGVSSMTEDEINAR